MVDCVAVGLPASGPQVEEMRSTCDPVSWRPANADRCANYAEETKAPHAERRQRLRDRIAREDGAEVLEVASKITTSHAPIPYASINQPLRLEL